MFNFDFTVVLERWPVFLDGALLAIQLALLATVIGFVIGTLCAIGRRSSIDWIAKACGMYVEAIRNTPLPVQISLVYFGLSSLGVSLSAFTVAVIALVSNVGAYTTEIMRAGFDSIDARSEHVEVCF